MSGAALIHHKILSTSDFSGIQNLSFNPGLGEIFSASSHSKVNFYPFKNDGKFAAKGAF
jgi:hypothetical protein